MNKTRAVNSNDYQENESEMVSTTVRTPQASQYNPCCCSTTTACLIVAWCEVILMIPVVAAALVFLCVGNNSRDYIDWEFRGVCFLVFATSCMFLFAPCCLIYSVNTGKTSYFIPYVSCVILKGIGLLIGILILLGKRQEPAAILLLLVLAFEIYKMSVVRACYREISKMNADASQIPVMVPLNPTAPPQYTA